MDFASQLFGSEAVQRHALEESGVYRSEMLKWAEGQGALLIVSVGEPRVDLMLLGSRGSIYHEA